MKILIKLFLLTFIISAASTQLVLAVGDMLGYAYALRRHNVSAAIYFCCVAVSGITLVAATFSPVMPIFRLKKILAHDGYSSEFYAALKKWYDKATARYRDDEALMFFAEALIDGGHIRHGLEMLETIDPQRLSRSDRPAYYNVLLYAAVCCGNTEAAERIYNAGKPYLMYAVSPEAAASVKHTLGCYECLRGDLPAAERLFTQALGDSPSLEDTCELRLALAVCYLESGRLPLAKHSVDKASEFAVTMPLRKKVERAKTLVEEAFRTKLNDSEQ